MAILDPRVFPQREDRVDQPLPIAFAEAITPQDLSAHANAKNLPLDIEYDGSIPQSIQSDPIRLRQILINLIGNAVKFTETGKVRLVARLLDAECDKPKMQIDVVDSGIGMTDQQITKLFKPFQQQLGTRFEAQQSTCLSDPTCDVEAARTRLLTALGEGSGPAGGDPVGSFGQTYMPEVGGDLLRAGTDAILIRHGVQVKEPHAAARTASKGSLLGT